MTFPRRLTFAAATIAIAATATATTVAAPEPQQAGALKEITAKGVGKVKLGKSYKSLRKAGLIGKLGPGCELEGPRARSARLKAPLEGTVDFNSKRRVRHITVIGGGAARGVRAGDSEDDVLKEFPKAQVDTSTQDRYGVTIVRVPKTDGGRIDFVLESDVVRSIHVPGVSFCE